MKIFSAQFIFNGLIKASRALIFLNILIKQILYEMRGHKLRTFLALFGIVWGTLTVVLLLALSHGFQQTSRRNILQIADGAFFVIASNTEKSYRGFPKGQPINLKASTIMGLAKAIPNIQYVSPILTTKTQINFKNKNVSLGVFGVSSHFNIIRKFNLIPQSRFIKPVDIRHKKRICILGNKIAKRLFDDDLTLPKTVKINNAPFTVVGIIESSKKSIRNYYENNALIPYSSFLALWGNQNAPYFVAKPAQLTSIPEIENDMRSYFATKLHFSLNDKTALRIFNTTKIYRFFKWFFIGIQLFLGTCGALTLGIGSLGIANIMFLTVTERTREIGIRMAIGATTWNILFQILIEALVITLFGGLIGFVIAASAVHLLHYITLPEWLGKPELSDTTIITSGAILAAFGLLAGYFPARRATKMDPVEALGG